MNKLLASAACAVAGLSLMAAPLPAESYDSEGGINWFGDYDEEAVGSFDSAGTDEIGFAGDDDIGFDSEIGDDETFESDEFGSYDSEHNWNTDDGWFEGWYGDSDELF